MSVQTTAAASLALALLPTAALSAEGKEDKATRKLMHEYARCVVKGNGDRASEAIIANSDNSTIRRRYSSLIDSECMMQTGGNVEMRFGGDLYRYALADALVNLRLAATVPGDFVDRLPLAHLPFPERASYDKELARTKSKRQRDEIEDGYRKQVGVAWLSRYGECIVRQSPTKARLWLLTPPDGPEEISRINDLRPAFAACIRDEGTIKFNRTTLRGSVAINYYRLAMATPVTAAARQP